MKNEYRVLIGDTLKRLSELELEHGKYKSLIVDQPFNIANKNDILTKKRRDISVDFNWDYKEYDDFLNFTDKWIKMSSDIMDENASVHMFCADFYFTDCIKILEKHGFEYRNIFVWHKTNPPPKFRKRTYVVSCGFVIFATRGKYTFNWKGQNEMHNFQKYDLNVLEDLDKDDLIMIIKELVGHLNSDLMEIGSPPWSKRFHPTQKPLKLIEHIVNITTDSGDYVLDPFLGSGSTMEACYNNNVSCSGIDFFDFIYKTKKNRFDKFKIKNEIDKKYLIKYNIEKLKRRIGYYENKRNEYYIEDVKVPF